MKAKTKLFFFLCASLFACTGCMTVDFTAQKIAVPVVMNGKIDRPYRVVAHFTVSQKKSALFLSRLVGAGEPDINEMIQRQLSATPGDAVINVRIHGETEAGDVVLPILVGTAGSFVLPFFAIFIVEPLFADLKSYTVEGDVIEFADSRLPEKRQYKIDPLTGLPVEQKRGEFDPETGLPKK